MREEPYVVGVWKNGWVYAGPFDKALDLPREMLAAEPVVYPSRAAALYTAMSVPVVGAKAAR